MERLHLSVSFFQFFTFSLNKCHQNTNFMALIQRMGKIKPLAFRFLVCKGKAQLVPRRFRLKDFIDFKALPDAIYLRYIPVHDQHVTELHNLPLRNVMADITGADYLQIPKGSNALVRFMKLYQCRLPESALFH